MKSLVLLTFVLTVSFCSTSPALSVNSPDCPSGVTSIARVDVLNTLASISIFGPNTEYVSTQIKPADGVISVTTRSVGFFDSYKVLLHSAKINFSGYDEPRIFYSPKHHTNLQSDYKPDLRTTLFWEPNITVENNKETVLNYSNADNPALVRVSVEGITSNGIPVTGKLEYEVK